ncbi:phospholipase A and acyltransferase 1-like [Ochotona princeps]|uniref:phospholipase A and acyltransferase 1-like n=1 Tax=Ochotona princeps TaxID=9978 RepID=UPI0027149730|nr:phospholipase A and acyltransferase 1-like [Ochotona princeps]
MELLQFFEKPQPMPGDIIKIFHFRYTDWAIYVGDGYVIHLTPCPDSYNILANCFSYLRGKAKATEESLKNTAGFRVYKVHNHLDHKFRPRPVNEIIASAKRLVCNSEEYQFLIENREKFVDDLRYGQKRRPLSSESPQPGDLIEISRLGYQHWAVYVGGGYVVHLLSSGLFSFISGSKDSSPIPFKGSVKRELLEEVLRGDKYSVNNLLDDKYRPRPVEEIVRLAESLVGGISFYNVLLSNCEHFATKLRYGKRNSNQVRSRVMALGGLWELCSQREEQL